MVEGAPHLTMSQHAAAARAKYPDPSDGLAHTLAVFADEPDEAFVVVATGNIYGPGVRTGLTWGDLRRLAWKADDPPQDCWPSHDR